MKKVKNNLASIVLGGALASTSAFAGMGGSCGAGKCGGSMKKDMEQKQVKKSTMSCGAGKCGASMKEDTKLKKVKKAKMSCGAGKCGASMGSGSEPKDDADEKQW